ncbi:methyltransferase domain-containing protein [archaeon]|nr:methyltransferase domain-containing protein [archaeon]
MKQIQFGNSLEDSVFINFGIKLNGRTYDLMEKFKKNVMRGYDATYYANLAANEKREYYRMVAGDALKRLDFDPKYDKLLLDIGAGPGVLTVEVAKLIGESEIIGIDASDDMVDIAKQYAAKENVRNVNFVKCPAEEAAKIFKQNSCIIISRNTFHRIKDGRETLKQLYIVTAERNKPSLYIRDMNRNMSWQLILEESVSWSEKSKFDRLVENPAFYAPEELNKIMENSGIDNYKILDGRFTENAYGTDTNLLENEWVLLVNK